MVVGWVCHQPVPAPGRVCLITPGCLKKDSTWWRSDGGCWNTVGVDFQHKGVSKNRGKPPNHPFVHRVFHYKPSILGVFPLFLETPISITLQETITYPTLGKIIDSKVRMEWDMLVARRVCVWQYVKSKGLQIKWFPIQLTISSEFLGFPNPERGIPPSWGIRCRLNRYDSTLQLRFARFPETNLWWCYPPWN